MLKNHIKFEISVREINITDEVCISRPTPRRDVDQIYMKSGDLIMQTKLMANYLEDQDVLFMGDGDAMSLMFGLFARPKSMTVVDFDDRILENVRNFSKAHGFDIETRLYDVRDRLPEDMRNRFDFFYTNPPYGSKNEGESAIIFAHRCRDMCKQRHSGCLILPYDQDRSWTHGAMARIQSHLFDQGYIIAEMINKMHTYHLDDDFTLASSTLIVNRVLKSRDNQDYSELKFWDVDLY